MVASIYSRSWLNVQRWMLDYWKMAIKKGFTSIPAMLHWDFRVQAGIQQCATCHVKVGAYKSYQGMDRVEYNGSNTHQNKYCRDCVLLDNQSCDVYATSIFVSHALVQEGTILAMIVVLCLFPWGGLWFASDEWFDGLGRLRSRKVCQLFLLWSWWLGYSIPRVSTRWRFDGRWWLVLGEVMLRIALFRTILAATMTKRRKQIL